MTKLDNSITILPCCHIFYQTIWVPLSYQDPADLTMFCLYFGDVLSDIAITP